VSHRPLAIVSGLTLGDYLLWNWSLNGSHDVLALVSGLTLPPLALAVVWLLLLSLTRLIARATHRPAVQAGRPRQRADRDPENQTDVSTATAPPADQLPASAEASSGKLAA